MAEFDREQIIDKINKLMRKAEKTMFPEEAQASILAAQKLLLRYKIEQHELTPEEAETIKVVDVMSVIQANTAWGRALVHIFAENFGTLVYYRKNGNRTYPVFFGEEEKALVCKALYDYTSIWLNKRACAYATKMRNTAGIVKGVKQDYIVGFLQGLSDKFQEQVKADQEMYALVVVVPHEVQQAFDKKEFDGTTKPLSIQLHGLAAARREGYRAGKNFDTDSIANPKEQLEF